MARPAPGRASRAQSVSPSVTEMTMASTRAPAWAGVTASAMRMASQDPTSRTVKGGPLGVEYHGGALVAPA
jgi:hypothetical protein